MTDSGQRQTTANRNNINKDVMSTANNISHHHSGGSGGTTATSLDALLAGLDQLTGGFPDLDKQPQQQQNKGQQRQVKDVNGTTTRVVGDVNKDSTVKTSRLEGRYLH